VDQNTLKLLISLSLRNLDDKVETIGERLYRTEDTVDKMWCVRRVTNKVPSSSIRRSLVNRASADTARRNGYGAHGVTRRLGKILLVISRRIHVR
jgi:hypothetical protein